MEKTKDEIKEDIRKALNSKVTTKTFKVLGIIIAIMLIFHAGIDVGMRKASYGVAWEQHYNENFGMGREQIRTFNGRAPNNMGFMESYFPNPHGATGKILKVELPNIIVQGRDNTEKVIVIHTDTKIQMGRDTIIMNDLKVDDSVVVIGTPNEQGQIEAKFIRVIPSPEFLRQ